MSTRIRRGRKYYYRSIREGGRVRSQYLGTDPAAAQELEDNKAKRLSDRQQTLAFRELADQVQGLSQKLAAEVESLVSATLIAAGWHCHKGTWRKRKNDQPK